MLLFTDLVVYDKCRRWNEKKQHNELICFLVLKQPLQWNTFRSMQSYIFAHGK